MNHENRPFTTLRPVVFATVEAGLKPAHQCLLVGDVATDRCPDCGQPATPMPIGPGLTTEYVSSGFCKPKNDLNRKDPCPSP